MNKDKCSNIKERILYFAKLKQLKLGFFFETIGMTSANFRGKAQETPINSATIEVLFNEFPEINLEWLLTGKGDVIKKNFKQAVAVEEDVEFLRFQVAKLIKDKEALIADKESLILDKALLASVIENQIKKNLQ